MNQRSEFALKSLCKGVVFDELCREFRISRKTGYKWRERFLKDGMNGLYDRSRRPHGSPDALPESVICEMIRIKHAHPHWGAHKIHRIFLRTHGEAPCVSSFKRIFDKVGLVQHRRRRPVCPQQRIVSTLPVTQSNDVWTVDFKGWWKMLGGGRCEPLTIRDQYSRYILEIKAMESTRTSYVKNAFEHVFKRYGLPAVILTDNGPPFAVPRALLGLSNLSVWWISLGIHLHRIKPGHPEQNGSHERMHRDIKMEIQGRVDGRNREHQAAFDIWREEYNWVRPHEAINMKVPGDVYVKSPRRWADLPELIDYGQGTISRSVTKTGSIGIDGRHIRISTTLRGYEVGLRYVTENVMDVFFDYLHLGSINLDEEQFFPAY